ncbi:malonyl-ACP O-methyltransferase BioC [Cucumibacter marinus]|uniref:hypothetical protein n=1 Tax=Cucumibacter marinus TaxID=1121252 RepID=UPI0004904163|nr:hypothetical protein [Cucumibacter marinus]
MTATPPRLFDRDLMAWRLKQAAAEADFVTELAVNDLMDRLAPIKRRFEKALVMAPRAEGLPKTAATADGPISFETAATLAPGTARQVDPEALDLGATDYDLIVSLFDLSTVNDVPGFLVRLRQHLRPDGLLIAATLGGNSLTELRRAWLAADAETVGGAAPRIAPMIEVRDAGALLQRAGFALPVTDVETHRVRYADPIALMRELKSLGAANPLAERPKGLVTPNRLVAAARHYAEIAGDPDGRVGATLEIIWMSGWAPDESQQKPLAPGSAKASLRDVLGDKSD